MSEILQSKYQRAFTLKVVVIFSNMTGIEYEILHIQDPILSVIRKQHRHSPTQGMAKTLKGAFMFQYFMQINLAQNIILYRFP